MQTKNNNKALYFTISLIIISLLIITFSFGYYYGATKNKKVTTKYILEYDTIKVIEKAKLITKRDTIRLKDTIIVTDSVNIAILDTMYSDSMYLKIKYYFPPYNYFDVFYRYPIKEKIVYKDKLIEDRGLTISFGVGILAGRRGIDYGLFVGVSRAIF